MVIPRSSRTPTRSGASGRGKSCRALAKLEARVERDPRLRARRTVLEARSLLDSIEKRIELERTGFNAVVGSYNAVLHAPTTGILARLLGFSPKLFLVTEADAEPAQRRAEL
jgi:hypothetical protein